MGSQLAAETAAIKARKTVPKKVAPKVIPKKVVATPAKKTLAKTTPAKKVVVKPPPIPWNALKTITHGAVAKDIETDADTDNAAARAQIQASMQKFRNAANARDAMRAAVALPRGGSAVVVESTIRTIRQQQAQTNGLAFDKKTLDLLDMTYKTHVEKNAAEYNSLGASVQPYLKLDKAGTLIGFTSEAGRKRVEALLASDRYKKVAAEFTRLHGNGKTQGTYVPTMLTRKDIAEGQRQYLYNIYKESVFNNVLTGKGKQWDIERTDKDALKDWNAGGKYFYSTAKASIDPLKTSLKRTESGWVPRTIDEEFEYRQAQYRAKVRAEFAAYVNKQKMQASVRGKLYEGEGGMLANSDALALGAAAKRLGFNESTMRTLVGSQKVVAAAMAEWEQKNRRLFFGSRDIYGGGSGAAAYARARAEAEKRMFNYLGTSVPGILDRFFSTGGGKAAIDLLSAGMGAIGAGAKVLATVVTGRPAEFIMAGRNYSVKDLPASTQSKYNAEVQRLMSDSAFSKSLTYNPASGLSRQQQIKREAEKQAWQKFGIDWLNNTPDGQRWREEKQLMSGGFGITHGRTNAETKRIYDELAKFYDEFYDDNGKMDMSKAIGALSDYGSRPFTPDSAVANLVAQIALDPFIAVPLKFWTWSKRLDFAIDATKDVNGFRKTAQGIVNFQTVSEEELRMRQFFKKELTEQLNVPGADAEKLIEDAWANVKGIRGKGAQERATEQFVRDLGLTSEQKNSRTYLSIAEAAIRKKFSDAGVPYETVADRVRKENEAIALAEKAEINAEKARVAKVLRERREKVKEGILAGKTRNETARELQRVRLEGQVETRRALDKLKREHAAAAAARAAATPPPAAAATPPPAAAATPLPVAPVAAREMAAATPQARLDAALAQTAERRVNIIPQGVRDRSAPVAHDPTPPPYTPIGRDIPSAVVHRYKDVTFDIDENVTFASQKALDDFLATPVGKEAADAIEDLRIDDSFLRGARDRAAEDLEQEIAAYEVILGRLPKTGGSADVRIKRVEVNNEIIKLRGKLYTMRKSPLVQKKMSGASAKNEMIASLRTVREAARESFAAVEREAEGMGARLREEGIDFRERGAWINSDGEVVPASRIEVPTEADVIRREGLNADDPLHIAYSRHEREAVNAIAVRLALESGYWVSAMKKFHEVIASGTSHEGRLALAVYYRAQDRWLKYLEKELRPFGLERRAADMMAADLEKASSVPMGRADNFLPIGERLLDDALNDDLTFRAFGRLYETFTLANEAGRRAVSTARDFTDKIAIRSYRARFNRLSFAKLMGTPLFAVAPTSPMAFRASGEQLFALFHYNLLDGTSGLVRLKRYTEVIDNVLAKDPDNLYARMWRVMEVRSGVPWAKGPGRGHLDSEILFQKAALEVKESGIHPNLALGMIPYGPIARRSPHMYGTSQHMRGITNSESALLPPGPAAWDDGVILSGITRIADGVKPIARHRGAKVAGLEKITAEAALRHASMMYSWVAQRYGNTFKRQAFLLRFRDKKIQALMEGLNHNLAGRIIARQEYVASEVARAGAEVEAAAGAYFDKILGMKHAPLTDMPYTKLKDMPYGKEDPRDILDRLYVVLDRLYLQNMITHDKPGLHAFDLYTRLQDPLYIHKGQHAPAWRAFRRHMKGDLDAYGDEIEREIRKEEFEAAAAKARVDDPETIKTYDALRTSEAMSETEHAERAAAYEARNAAEEGGDAFVGGEDAFLHVSSDVADNHVVLRNVLTSLESMGPLHRKFDWRLQKAIDYIKDNKGKMGGDYDVTSRHVPGGIPKEVIARAVLILKKQDAVRDLTRAYKNMIYRTMDKTGFGAEDIAVITRIMTMVNADPVTRGIFATVVHEVGSPLFTKSFVSQFFNYADTFAWLASEKALAAKKAANELLQPGPAVRGPRQMVEKKDLLPDGSKQYVVEPVRSPSPVTSGGSGLRADEVADKKAKELAEYLASRPVRATQPHYGVTRIISGGQTGGDKGGLLAGRSLGIETGGTAPRGWKTERGSEPGLADFGLKEHENPSYIPRTMKNVDDADATVAFLLTKSVGTGKTIGYAQTGRWGYGTNKTLAHGGHRPVLVINEADQALGVDHIAKVIRLFLDGLPDAKTLNIAGHRETSVAGIEKLVQDSLEKALRSTPPPAAVKTEVLNIKNLPAGWDKDPNIVYIGRVGQGKEGYFGNPFRAVRGQPPGSTLPRYKKWMWDRIDKDPEFAEQVKGLEGKKLACFDAPNPCHGDVLADAARHLNEGTRPAAAAPSPAAALPEEPAGLMDAPLMDASVEPPPAATPPASKSYDEMTSSEQAAADEEAMYGDDVSDYDIPDEESPVAAAPAAPPPVAAAPPPAVLATAAEVDSPELLAAIAKLEAFTGMSHEDWLAKEFVRLNTQFRKARTSGEKNKIARRIKDVRRAQAVASGKRSLPGYISPQMRHQFVERMKKASNFRHHGYINGNQISPYIASAAGADVEMGRFLFRLWRRAPVLPGRLGPLGVASVHYSKRGAELDKIFDVPIADDLLRQLGVVRADLRAKMTGLTILSDSDELMDTLTDPRFRAFISTLRQRVDARLMSVTGDANYHWRDYLNDRLTVRGRGYDWRTFETHRGLVATGVTEARQGYRYEGLTRRRVPKEDRGDFTPSSAEPTFEWAEPDIQAVIGKARVLADLGVSVHQYNEARKLFEGVIVRRRTGLDMLGEAEAEAFARLGVRSGDEFDAVRDELFLAKRKAKADREADVKFDELARENVGHPISEILSKFDALYGEDGAIKGFNPDEISEFQKASLESAIKSLLGVSDLNDLDQMRAALAAHGQGVNLENSKAMREELVRRGTWSPRRASAIEAGDRKSWSLEQEAAFMMDNYAYIPDRSNPVHFRPGGKWEDLPHDPELYGDVMRSLGTYSRNMEARAKTGRLSREELVRAVALGDVSVNLLPARDLPLLRKYVIDRFGDIASTDGHTLIAFPQFMTPAELKPYILGRAKKTIPDGMIKTVDQLAAVGEAIDKKIGEFLDVTLFAGKTATFEDLFKVATDVVHDLMKSPVFRKRDVSGHLLRTWSSFWMNLIFTNFSFATMNGVDTFIKETWHRAAAGSFFTNAEKRSARARELDAYTLGFDRATQLLTDIKSMGTARIKEGMKNKSSDPRALWDVGVGLIQISPEIAGRLEIAAKVRLAQGMYDKVYAEALAVTSKGAKDPDLAAKLADAKAIEYIKESVSRFWPTQGDGVLERLFNQMAPFFSYTIKNNVLFIGEMMNHPALFTYFDKIGDYIEQQNRAEYAKKHPEDPLATGLPESDARKIELPWAPGTYLDLGSFSDASRGFKPVFALAKGDLTPRDVLATWTRLISPAQQNIGGAILNAMHIPQRYGYAPILKNGYPTGAYERVAIPWMTPWGTVADGWSSFWPLEAGKMFLELNKDGLSATDATLLASQLFFFGAIKPGNKVLGLSLYYYALKAKDPDAAEIWMGTPDGQALQTAWMMRGARVSDVLLPAELTDIVNPRSPKSEWWRQSDEWRRAVTDGRAGLDQLSMRWDRIIGELTPGTKEYSDAKMQAASERYVYYSTHPELFEADAMGRTSAEWMVIQDKWRTDDLKQGYFNMIAPDRDMFKTEADYRAARVEWMAARAAYLVAHPDVAASLAQTRSQVEAVWKKTEEGWFEILDRIGARKVAIDAAKAAKDYDLLDQLYTIQELDYAQLDRDMAVFYFDPLTDFQHLKYGQMGPPAPLPGNLLARVKILPDFTSWRYSRMDDVQKSKFEADQKYAEGMKRVIGTAKKGGSFDGAVFVKALKSSPWLLNRYFEENPGKREQWAWNDAYIAAISPFGQMMAKGKFTEAWRYFDSLSPAVKARYYAKHPDTKAKRIQGLQYMNYMEKWVGFMARKDYAGGAAYFASMPKWAQDKYLAKHPKTEYQKAMAKWSQYLENGNQDAANRYFDSLPAGIRAQYYKTHPYAKAMSGWGALLEKGDIEAANKYFDALPEDVKAQYYAKNPYAKAMSEWSDLIAKGDKAASFAYFDAMPQEYKDKYFAAHPDSKMKSRSTGSGYSRSYSPRGSSYPSSGGSAYSQAMKGWVELLKAGKSAEARAYFNALSQEFKDIYYENHPDVKLRNDIMRTGQLALYFAASDAGRAQYLLDNPEFAQWLKENDTSDAQRKMLILAAYEALDPGDQWLKRLYREKYPEIFSDEAAGEDTLRKVYGRLEENPEMLPGFEKWVSAIWASYAENLKHTKNPPKPLEAKHVARMNKRPPIHAGMSALWVRLHSTS